MSDNHKFVLQNTLLDNSIDQLKMANVFNKILSDIDINEIMIATGYWDLPGTKLIYDNLSSFLSRNGTTLKLIIGQEPVLRSYQKDSAKHEEREFPDFYIKRDVDLLSDDYLPVAKLLNEFCGDEEESKVQIRIYGQGENKQFLHAKCYIFNGNQVFGIIGSSNFTKKGLEDNSELNYLETSPLVVTYENINLPNVKGHIVWFNQIWDQGVPWSGKFLEEILKPSPIGQQITKDVNEHHDVLSDNISPHDVYIKFLQTQWGDILDQKNTQVLQNFLPPEMHKLQYQFDAVNQGYSIMKQHNGFILADVVGLGKTMVGIMIIKRFIDDYNIENRSRKVLIVTPPAIQKSWKETIDFFESSNLELKQNIDFISTGKVTSLNTTEVENNEIEGGDEEIESDDYDLSDINNIDLNKNQYGLIIIDESHKFRNSETNMYQAIDSLIGQTYPAPYVVLLSATPQNNSPEDLKNQIYLFQREPQNTTLDTIKGRKLDTFFVAKQKEFKMAKKNKDYDAIKELSKEIRQKVLDYLVVRRTRTDIMKYYQDDSAELKFPSIEGPHALKYEMDEELSLLFYDTMEIIAPTDPLTGEFKMNEQGVQYYRYRAIEFLKSAEHKKLYENRNLTVDVTSTRLASLMQILLVKRLESSFSAFKASLHNLKRYTNNMIEMLEDNCVFICPDIDVNKELDVDKKAKKKNQVVTKEDCYNDIRNIIKRKPSKNRVYRTDDFENDYLEKLKRDKKIIDDLCERWSKNNYDPKLEAFLKQLDTVLFSKKINNPHGHDTQKLVIFTEAIDTLRELERRVKNKKYRVLAITSENRKDKETVIKENFDANYLHQKNDFDVIITTDVLSEGVNLHRSNIIVNYDTPWNSTRLMQRIGRVNRIGSKEDKVHVYNFMPTAESDAHIDLVNKAHAKLQSFHAMFGEDNKVYTIDEDVSSYGKDPDELRKLIDGEESPLEKYISELKQYKEKNPEKYIRIKKIQPPLLCAKKHKDNESVFIVKTADRPGLNICIDEQGNQQELNTLETIEKLYCREDEPGLSLPAKFDTIMEKSKEKYLDLFVKMTTSKDSNKKCDQARGIIKNLHNRSDISDDTKELLKQAMLIVKNGNRQLAGAIIKIDKEISNGQDKLVGIEDMDINDFVKNKLQAIRNNTKTSLNLDPVVTIGVSNLKV
jgi:superfamily II DNA or RNA helicase